MKSELDGLVTTRFYYRVPEQTGDSVFYEDFLVLEDYKNDFFTIDNLVRIAYQYVDTITSDKPVVGVTYVAEYAGQTLPKGRFETYSQHKDYQVFSIRFLKSAKHDANSVNVSSIAFWKDGEAVIVNNPSDSLLTSQKTLSIH